MKIDPHTIQCKTIGHQWEEIPYTGEIQWDGDPLLLRCLSCHSERLDYIDSLGGLVHRGYDPSPEYKKVLTMSRAQWRVEYLQVRKLIISRNNRRNRLRMVK
jgi:hypothetical protein